MTTTPSEITAAVIPKISSGFRLQFEKQQDAWVLLYPEGMVKLNQSAGEIMQRCDGVRNVGQVIDALEQAFEQAGLGDDVRAFLAIACDQNWITLEPS